MSSLHSALNPVLGHPLPVVQRAPAPQLASSAVLRRYRNCLRMPFSGKPEGCEAPVEESLETPPQERSGRRESAHSKVTCDSRDRSWCLESVFLLVYGADQCELTP